MWNLHSREYKLGSTELSFISKEPEMKHICRNEGVLKRKCLESVVKTPTKNINQSRVKLTLRTSTNQGLN